MISDDDLYRIAIFLGSAAMVLIVLYHFFEVNADESQRQVIKEKGNKIASQAPAATTTKTR